jgi:hypothetical protein
VQLHLESRVEETPRVLQVRGLFDLPDGKSSRFDLEADLPLGEQPWNIGLITGPSGSGKSQTARRLWPAELARSAALSWPSDRALVDAFPPDLPVKEVVALLSSVGFSSPPCWLRPFPVLSTGQQFRATLARLLAESPDLAVFDEYTSVVDRTVARIGSAALSNTVRRRGQKFVAVTCHEDVIDWLRPDWVFRPHEARFEWRFLQRRPPVPLTVFRCQSAAWGLFAPHHYLSGDLNASATCFLATWQGVPVAFSAWLPFVSPGPPTRREHRTVTLPDFQGVGIGNTLSDTVASLFAGLGYKARSTTTHPAMIRSRLKSPNWRMVRSPSFSGGQEGGLKHATTRATAGFEFIGTPMERGVARRLLST